MTIHWDLGILCYARSASNSDTGQLMATGLPIFVLQLFTRCLPVVAMVQTLDKTLPV